LLVASLLAFVISLPLLSQPLGLAFSWHNPVVDADDATDEFPEYTEEAGELGPLTIDDFTDNAISRSLNALEEPDSSALEPGYSKKVVLDDQLGLLFNHPLDDPDNEAAPEPVYEPADHILYISANRLNLRAAASTDSAIIADLKFGDKIRCIGENDEWMQVERKGVTGFVKAEYTSKTMVFENVSQTVYVDASKLNLRKAPSTESEIILKLSAMQKLTRTGIGDGWSRVRTSTGKTGYVASEYLTTKAPVPSSSVNGPTYPGSAGRIVDLAYSALGVPYVHCGSGMSGFDCSGLTSWAYRQIGIAIPRSTSGYYNLGRGVAYADIRPADIICMDTKQTDGKTTITHVGIYVGNGMMIHASSTKGKVVLQNVKQYFSWGVKLISVRRILG
jgi:cell wall-associated NlpC family hydrolase